MGANPPACLPHHTLNLKNLLALTIMAITGRARRGLGPGVLQCRRGRRPGWLKGSLGVCKPGHGRLIHPLCNHCRGRVLRALRIGNECWRAGGPIGKLVLDPPPRPSQACTRRNRGLGFRFDSQTCFCPRTASMDLDPERGEVLTPPQKFLKSTPPRRPTCGGTGWKEKFRAFTQKCTGSTPRWKTTATR